MVVVRSVVVYTHSKLYCNKLSKEKVYYPGMAGRQCFNRSRVSYSSRVSNTSWWSKSDVGLLTEAGGFC